MNYISKVDFKENFLELKYQGLKFDFCVLTKFKHSVLGCKFDFCVDD